MYKYKIHRKSKWWNPDTMEDEEQAYCREKNYRLLTANWKNVDCKSCLNLYRIRKFKPRQNFDRLYGFNKKL